MKKTLLALSAAAALLTLPLGAHALVYQFNAGLDGGNETVPNTLPGTGVATLFYDDMDTLRTGDDSFSFALSAFGLSGPITGAHIHSPAPMGSNGPIVVPLDAAPFVLFNSGGTLLVGGSDVAPPYASFLSELRSNLAYVNVHTALLPAGEIRGQLIQVAVVPEPATTAMLLAGLAAVGVAARRRGKTAS